MIMIQGHQQQIQRAPQYNNKIYKLLNTTHTEIPKTIQNLSFFHKERIELFNDLNYHLNLIIFYSIDKSMQQSRQNVITSGNAPQYQYRSSQNLGLPINSRFISEANQNAYLNNYQSFNPILSPQQIYTNNPDPNAVRVSNVAYQSNVNPITSYTIPSPVNSEQLNTFQNNLQSQRSTRNIVRSRFVPVTQYVPVYEYENVQTVPQTIHQRVILHEPEAFKERTVFEQKNEALPTLVEQYKIEEAPERIVNTKVVRVSQDPVVQTVPGGWRSKVSESKVSYVPPAPLPREQKPCCSGWLLLLLGLLALGGVLTAILLGKNSSSSTNEQQSITVAAGTKVSSSGPSKIQEVAPLTNVSFEVRGKTAVTSPVTLQPSKVTSSAVTYVPATDISVVAKAESTIQQNYVEPQRTNLVSVAPVIVHPNNSAQTVYPTVITENKTSTQSNVIQPNSATSQIHIVPVTNTTSVSRNSSVLNQNTVSASKVSSSPQNVINTTRVSQPLTVALLTVAPKSIQPISVAPIIVHPQNPTSNTTEMQSNKTIVQSNKTIPSYRNKTAFVPAIEVPPKEI